MNFLLCPLSFFVTQLPRLVALPSKGAPRSDSLVDIFRWPEGPNPLFHPESAVAFFIALGALLLAIRIYRRYTTENQEAEPLIVFHDIAKHFELSIKDQWLLIQIAKHQNLSTPLALIICRGTFHHYVERYMKSQPRPKQLALANEVTHIQATLFDQPNG